MAQLTPWWFLLFRLGTAFVTVRVLGRQITCGCPLLQTTILRLQFRHILNRTLICIDLVLEKSIEMLLVQVLYLVGLRTPHTF